MFMPKRLGLNSIKALLKVRAKPYVKSIIDSLFSNTIFRLICVLAIAFYINNAVYEYSGYQASEFSKGYADAMSGR